MGALRFIARKSAPFSLCDFFLPLWRAPPEERQDATFSFTLVDWGRTLGVFLECAQGCILGDNELRVVSKAFRVCEQLRSHADASVRMCALYVLSRILGLSNGLQREEGLWVKEWLEETVRSDREEARQMARDMLPFVRRFAKPLL